MSGYFLKAADQGATITMDWRRGYLAPGEAVAADLGWSIQPGCAAAGDLAVTQQDQDLSRSWARFEAGVPGRVYMVTGKVLTNAGRVLERAVVVRIALGPGGPH